MSHHTLTLIALGDDAVLLAVAGWWTVAEYRWHHRHARAATTGRHTAPQPHRPDQPAHNRMATP